MTQDEKTGVLIEILSELVKHTSYFKNDNLIGKHISQLADIFADGYSHSLSDLYSCLRGIAEMGEDQVETFAQNLRLLCEIAHGTWKRDNQYSTRLAEMIAAINRLFSDVNEMLGDFATKQQKRTAINDRTRSYAIEARIHSLEKQYAELIKTNNSNMSNMGSLNQQVENLIEKVNASVSTTVDKLKEYQISSENLENTLNSKSQSIESNMDTKIKEASSNLDIKLENNKISSLTSLTIFSAVVLAFSGGITLEMGMFSGISQSTPFRLIFMISLSGLVLFDTVFMLLYIVGKMTGSHIGMGCRYMSKRSGEIVSSRTCGEGECARENCKVTALCKLRHRFVYVGAVNSLLLLIMYYDFSFWLIAGWGYKILGTPTLSGIFKLFLLFAPVLLCVSILLSDKLFKSSKKAKPAVAQSAVDEG